MISFLCKGQKPNDCVNKELYASIEIKKKKNRGYVGFRCKLDLPITVQAGFESDYSCSTIYTASSKNLNLFH